jgi:primosomal protein N'
MILDAQNTYTFDDLDIALKTVRIWMEAIKGVQNAENGGVSFVIGNAISDAITALLSWNPLGLIKKEIVDRKDLRFPPYFDFISIITDTVLLKKFMQKVQSIGDEDILGPVKITDSQHVPLFKGDSDLYKIIVRVEKSQFEQFAKELMAFKTFHSSKSRKNRPLRIELDPLGTI